MFEKETKQKTRIEFSEQELSQLDIDLESYRSENIFKRDCGSFKKGDKIWDLALEGQFRYLQDKGIICVDKEITKEMQLISDFPEIKIRMKKVKEYVEFERKLEQLNASKVNRKLGNFGI